MEPEDPLHSTKLLQPISSSASKSSRLWSGSVIVVLAAIFFVLSTNEGHPSPHQRLIDSLFHTWFAMGGVTVALWLSRRGTFGPLPRLIRIVAAPLLAFFLLVSMLDFLSWRPLWDVLKPFGIVQADAVPIAIMGVFAIWGIGITVLVLRGTVRWFRRRYEHHGVAVGFGPLYFYFRRRRAS
jgi:hypothetical protein